MTIHWPNGLAPEETTIHTRNELLVDTDVETIWNILVDAPSWPGWYANARRVALDDVTELGPGTRFRWTTFNFRVDCVVTLFDPHRELAWTGTAFGTRGHHRWLLEPRPGGGALVAIEETQRGLLPGVAGRWIRPCLLHWHQRWLEGLASAQPLRA
ncbi:SRPBCC domain-containing protein [Amycolatopsis sp. CA-126428]|uniref:SRPBCC domain-containing protein n=1 Tax=Amycolatopsis sp. CA-126428 TaxID=2073158 RepID=UPI000CD2E984|nr:SRPBCC domain-containing protein [Amycolatopsis sp. CA-126428]